MTACAFCGAQNVRLIDVVRLSGETAQVCHDSKTCMQTLVCVLITRP